MPNWCFTNYIFYSDNEAEINALRDKLDDWTSKEGLNNDFGEAWLGNILYHAELAERINASPETRVNCRGWVENISDVWFNENKVTAYMFSLTTGTAWEAIPRIFEIIIEKLGYDIRFVFQSEENDTGCYEIYDPDNTGFFDDKDVYINASVEDVDSAIAKHPFLKDIIDVEHCSKDFINKWLKKNGFGNPNDINSLKLPDEDDELSIHFFERIDKWW